MPMLVGLPLDDRGNRPWVNPAAVSSVIEVPAKKRNAKNETVDTTDVVLSMKNGGSFTFNDMAAKQIMVKLEAVIR
jgi:hypothetical protein